MATIMDTICKPFRVAGNEVTGDQIARAIDLLANADPAFEASILTRAILPLESYHASQEAVNRLMQRWRKLGLATFKSGRWKLTAGAWDKMQTAAGYSRNPA